jgi:YYY domain-containing protein
MSDQPEQKTSLTEVTPQVNRIPWFAAIILIGVLMAGAYFRFIGLNWDDVYHLHPDERFLTMVETSISPVDNLFEYFNTATSSLNPANNGYTFYVYGTLPLFLVRYVAEWTGQTGYNQVHLIGRGLSGFVDLFTIFLVFLIAFKLFKNYRLGLLAAAFSAGAVMQIQLAHYFTVDNFANFFVYLAIYFAVVLIDRNGWARPEKPESDQALVKMLIRPIEHLWVYMLFGLALGLAASSKVSAAPIALLLPAAAFIRWVDTPADDREWMAAVLLRNLVIAALISLITFRIFQPYAFNGVFSLNPSWLASLKELSAMSKGDVDFPPALQWARRPLSFAFTNMVRFGLGIPLGVLAWSGFLWMGWKLFRGEWKKYSLLWGWTAFYFTWQSLNFTRSMRYQIHVYPALAIIAAWAVFTLWGHRSAASSWLSRNWRKMLAVFAGVSVLAGTFVWAYMFTRIYTRPVTRVEASRWIYQNVPAPINLRINTGSGIVNHPQPFRAGVAVNYEMPLRFQFTPKESGQLIQIRLPHVLGMGVLEDSQLINVSVFGNKEDEYPLSIGTASGDFNARNDPRGDERIILLDIPVVVEANQPVYVEIRPGGTGGSFQLTETILAGIYTNNGELIEEALPEAVEALKMGDRYSILLTNNPNGLLEEITIPHIVDWEAEPGRKTLRISILSGAPDNLIYGSAEVQSEFFAGNDPRGEGYTFRFDPPITIEVMKSYVLSLSFENGPGRVAIYGSKHVNESSWDDAIPIGLDGYSPYDYYMGLYHTDLNFEMYWDDNVEKYQRFVNNLNQADYVFITSNRQWGTTTRVPERYPLTSEYYRQLLGCPPEKEITWCYSVAKPGMFKGNLGFELIKISQSDPNLGSFYVNTQFAEEAFTVYDHPKVLIFQKTGEYSSAHVREVLGKVDLDKVVRLTPAQAGDYPGDLTLPAARLQQQRNGGTWADLFNRESIINRWPVLTVLVWYLFITLLGWLVYPFTRLALGGLVDKGYPASRLVGLVLFALIAWWIGSFGWAVTRLTLIICLVLLAGLNTGLFIWQKDEILQELRNKRRDLLTIELISAGFFLFFLFVRLGNPDLWHPYKGGEKPMDFSYFNAVIKSTSFPPYDPWFAGGYINYYYYGFVLAGMPVKLLGIVPATAYNLILPSLYSLLALVSVNIGWNLITTKLQTGEEPVDESRKNTGLLAGLTTAILLQVFGNLGTVRQIWQSLQKIVAPGGTIEGAAFFQHLIWGVQGFFRYAAGTRLPVYPGDWYWVPSRVIPGEPITEFPMFTFLYADLHAHMLALPLTALAVLWAVSVFKRKCHWERWPQAGACLLLGGAVIGALRPTNTWDFPTYLALGGMVVFYTAFKYSQAGKVLNFLPEFWQKLTLAAAGSVVLVGISLVLYSPFAYWFGQAYNQVEIWKDARTPFDSYFTHWGLFLVILFGWIWWEIRDWMESTPATSLAKIYPYRRWIQAGLLLLAGLIVAAFFYKAQIVWLALPMAAAAGVLMLRPGLSDEKRFVSFLIGTALVLTIMVEFVRLSGDIGRMNTVFKFYLQAWTMLAISSGAAFFWLLPEVQSKWKYGWQTAWQTGITLLAAGALLFPIFGGFDKIRDRMSGMAPHTLDGMAYMAYSEYADNGQTMQLGEDYRAIQWMQENVQGSPVIMEANVPEYRWGNRFTIYTGLPGVVGWNWHQRQQRAIIPGDWVWERVNNVEAFYLSTDKFETMRLLEQYDVRYVVVGQLERAFYDGPGLEKFSQWENDLWKLVYLDGQTAIYQVIN